MPVAEALASDPLFVRPDADGRLVTTCEIRNMESKMIRLAADGQGKYEALSRGKEWTIRHPLEDFMSIVECFEPYK